MSKLLADKGYDGDGLRAEIIERGAIPVIPNKSNRVVIHPFNKRAYKGRNAIERCFCRIKDFRRIATRYDKLSLSERRIMSALLWRREFDDVPIPPHTWPAVYLTDGERVYFDGEHMLIAKRCWSGSRAPSMSWRSLGTGRGGCPIG